MKFSTWTIIGCILIVIAIPFTFINLKKRSIEHRALMLSLHLESNEKWRWDELEDVDEVVECIDECLSNIEEYKDSNSSISKHLVSLYFSRMENKWNDAYVMKKYEVPFPHYELNENETIRTYGLKVDIISSVHKVKDKINEEHDKNREELIARGW